MKKYIPWILSLVCMVLVIDACVVQKSPVTGNRRAYGYTWEQEKQIGAESDAAVQQQYGVYDSQSLQNYVDNVAQGVLSTSDLRDKDTPKKYRETEFHYKVLDSPIVNAFALPGGYVYVTRGLLAHLENEAQLAVVLGHETGHVAARHASQSALNQQLGQLALIGGAVAGQEFLGIPGGNILNLGSQAAQFLFLKYSRDDEREADELGVEYSAKSNYKAADGAAFFTTLRRMSEQSGQSIPEWQSTHPDPSERAKNIPKLAEKWKQKGYQETKEDTDQFMNAIDNMIYGENPRQGFTRNNTFYHPELAFQFPYPSGWQLVNQPSVVQMVNQDQNAIIIFQIDGQNNSARASVNEYLSQDGVNPTGSSATSNNGLNAYEATATAQTQDGADVSFYIYGVEYDGNVYRFVCYTLSEQFNQYSSQFQQTTNQFDRLRDSGILNIQPARLNVVRASRTASFQSFLPSNFPLDITAEDVAIANQVNLNDTIQKGTWIKIPR